MRTKKSIKPETSHSRFAYSVIRLIIQRLANRLFDIEQITSAEFGFEEWCNAELFTACRSVQDWSTRARPPYSEDEIESKEFGDLRVIETDDVETNPNAPHFMLEIKLARPSRVVSNSYTRENLMKDIDKLKTLTTYELSWRVLLVIEVSRDEFEHIPKWHDELVAVPHVVLLFEEPQQFRFPIQGGVRLHFFGVVPESLRTNK